MGKHKRLFAEIPDLSISKLRCTMTPKSHQEIRISIGQHDVDELQAGEPLQIGLIDFGLPIRISMKKRKSPEKVAEATC